MYLTHRPADPTVTIVVPARNEARNLELVLPPLPDVHEVIVVDGHSVDDTEDVVRRVLPGARFIQQTRKGKGNALACGFEAATGDVIVMFDADGSADASEIAAYVATLVAGADFAKGSRVLGDGGSEDITWLRDLGNRVLTGITNVLFRTRYTDLCYGYNAFWRDILPALAIPELAGRGAPSGATASRSRPSSTAGSPRPSLADPRGPERRARAHPRREQPQHLPRRLPGAAHDRHRALRGAAGAVAVPAADTIAPPRRRSPTCTSQAAHGARLAQPSPRRGRSTRRPACWSSGSGWRFTSGISYYTCSLANALAGALPTDALLMRQLVPTRPLPRAHRVGQVGQRPGLRRRGRRLRRASTGPGARSMRGRVQLPRAAPARRRGPAVVDRRGRCTATCGSPAWPGARAPGSSWSGTRSRTPARPGSRASPATSSRPCAGCCAASTPTSCTPPTTWTCSRGLRHHRATARRSRWSRTVPTTTCATTAVEAAPDAGSPPSAPSRRGRSTCSSSASSGPTRVSRTSSTRSAALPAEVRAGLHLTIVGETWEGWDAPLAGRRAPARPATRSPWSTATSPTPRRSSTSPRPTPSCCPTAARRPPARCTWP